MPSVNHLVLAYILIFILVAAGAFGLDLTRRYHEEMRRRLRGHRPREWRWWRNRVH